MFAYMKQGKPFYQDLVKLATPIILQNLVTTTVGLVDTFMVGRLGEEAIAAVQVANLPVFVVQLVVFGLMSGSSVLIAQYWGKKDTDSISRVIGIGWYIAGAVSMVFALAMALIPEKIMWLLTDSEVLIPLAAEYARPIGISYFFTSIAGVFNGAQRSMENPKFGLVNSSVSVVLNIIFNYVFIFGNFGAPAWGVFGAAVATLIARIGEFLVVVIYLARSKRFRINFKAVLRPGKELVARYVKYATPVVVNETLWGLGFSMYQVVMGRMAGAESILAAYTISGNLEKLFAVFMFGIGNTAAVIIGREIGAGRADKVFEKGKALATLSFLVGGVLGTLVIVTTKLVFEPFVYPIFDMSPLSSQVATLMLTMTGADMCLRAFNNCMVVGVLRGGGAVRTSMMIDVIPLWFVAVPLMFLFGWGLELGIFWVYAIHWIENIIKAFWGRRQLLGGRWIHDVTIASS